MALSVSAIEFLNNASDLIRGYNITLDFQVNVTNEETRLRIDPALPGTTNFNLQGVSARPGSRRRRDVSMDPASQVTQQIVVSHDQLSGRVNYSDTVTLTGQVQ